MKRTAGFYLVRILSISILAQLLLTYQSVAQDPKPFAAKGVVELGGSLSYQYTSSISQGIEIGHTNLLSILPYVGYFVNDNVEIGVNPLGIQTYWVNSNTSTAYKILVAPA